MKKISYNTKNRSEFNYVIPQEAPSYVKVPTNIYKWQIALAPGDFAFLAYLISRINKHKGYAYFSVKTASIECNMCENVIRKATKLFEELGLVFVSRDYKNNRYFLQLPEEPSMELLKEHLPKAYERIKARQQKKLEQEASRTAYRKISYNTKTDLGTDTENNNRNDAGTDTESNNRNDAGTDTESNNRNDAGTGTENKNKNDAGTDTESNNRNEAGNNANCRKGGPRDRPKNKSQNTISHKKDRYFDNKSQEKTQKNKEKIQKDTDFLKKEGVSSYMSYTLASNLPEYIDIKEYTSFVYSNVAQDMTLTNKPGFLIYSIRSNFYTEYFAHLEKQKENKERAKQETKLENEITLLQKKVNQSMEDLWESLGEEEQEKMKKVVMEENTCLKELKLRPDSLDGFYIRHLKNKNIPKSVIAFLENANLRTLDDDKITKYYNTLISINSHSSISFIELLDILESSE